MPGCLEALKRHNPAMRVIVVMRDAIILGGIRWLHHKQHTVHIAPHWSGKICTVTQMFALGWVMLKVVPYPPTWPCVVATVFTVWSAITYVRKGLDILRQLPVEDSGPRL